MANANPKPAIIIEIVIITVDIFYPIAPWKANESVANLEANYVWFITSNHPIYCLSKLLRYAFLHDIPCLYPTTIHDANIIQAAKNAPAPIYKKIYIVFLDDSTIISGSANESVIWPHMNENDGRATPIAVAAIVPTTIKKISNLVVNLKS